MQPTDNDEERVHAIVTERLITFRKGMVEEYGLIGCKEDCSDPEDRTPQPDDCPIVPYR